jgi:hypothetical protein
MTSEQTAARANDQGEPAGEPCLVLRAEDGTAYAIPQTELEGFRLSEEHRAGLEAQLAAGDSDLQGFYYGPSGNVGTFGGSVPKNPHAGSNSGFGVLGWLPAYYVTNTNRENPNGYRPLVR